MIQRVADRWDAVVLFTGEERVGKSTLVLRLTEEVARRTGLPFDWANLCYGGRPLVAAYRAALQSGLASRQIWFDEGGRGLFAGETLDPEQVVIVKTLQQAGVANAILYIATPDVWELAKRIRGRRAVFWVDVVARGTPSAPAPTRADVFERDRKRHFQPTRTLGFSRSRRCPELAGLPYASDDPTWAEYSRHKLDNLSGWLNEADAILDRYERTRGLGKGTDGKEPRSRPR